MLSRMAIIVNMVCRDVSSIRKDVKILGDETFLSAFFHKKRMFFHFAPC